MHGKQNVSYLVTDCNLLNSSITALLELCIKCYLVLIDETHTPSSQHVQVYKHFSLYNSLFIK